MNNYLNEQFIMIEKTYGVKKSVGSKIWRKL